MARRGEIPLGVQFNGEKRPTTDIPRKWGRAWEADKVIGTFLRMQSPKERADYQARIAETRKLMQG